MTYPQHEKLKQVKDESQAIGDFLEWLQNEQGFSIGTFHGSEAYEQFSPLRESTEKLLARYFDIDLTALENEKRQMLEELQRGTS